MEVHRDFKELLELFNAHGVEYLVVGGVLALPIAGSGALFMAGVALHLFATTSMGIYFGAVARSMPPM